MKKSGIEYRHFTSCRYAGELHKLIRKEEPGRLVDTLIVGAIIEARSCERFYSLIPHLDDELAKFYQSLLKSEARHFEDYLKLAEKAVGQGIGARKETFLHREGKTLNETDPELRFHSGCVESAVSG